MAQADSVITTLIPATAPRYPTGLDYAHIALIRAISATMPETIHGDAAACEVEDRAAHLRDLLKPVREYVSTITHDTAARSQEPIAARELIDGFTDSIAALIGAMELAANRYPTGSGGWLRRWHAETAR